MKLWLIEMNEVDWDEYNGFVVSANSKEEAIIKCDIKQNKDQTNKYADNLYIENIESIKEIGQYYKEESEIILSDFNQG